MTHETTPDPLTAPEALSEPAVELAAEPEFTDPSGANPPAEFAAEPEMAEEASAEPEPEAQSETASDAETPPEPRSRSTAEPPSEPEPPAEPQEDFGELLAAFEKTHSHRPASTPRQLSGTVVSITADQVFLDIGYKIEGVLPRTAFERNAEAVKPGDTLPVSITGRNEEGYYDLSRFRVSVPKDWTALEAAFAEKLAVAGTVTAVVKGGASVDVGVRAFMPASRSGTHDAAELEALVGQQITCRIIKLDTADEDVVVDRRAVLEEQAVAAAANRYAALNEGDTHQGTVRSLVSYGAFVEIGGVDGLLHVGDISWTRIARPEDVLSVGQQVEVRILHIDPETKKISLGMKQLQPEPWETVPARYQANQRISGRVTRVTDFGAFVEIEPGIEGLIHVSEMSWGKKVRIASDIVKPGDHVDAVILGIKPPEGPHQAGRISLGLKQTLTDPWSEAAAKFPVGAEVKGPVTKIMPFGAFVQVAEGIEGMVHISEIVSDRRLNHPSEALREGQVVQAQVLAIDLGKRQIKLSLKRLIPTSIDEYIAEHKPGDKVSGRVTSLGPIKVELGQGIQATSREVPANSAASGAEATAQGTDLSSLTSLLQARWKGKIAAPGAKTEPLAIGQVREFRIIKLDPKEKKIELEPADPAH